MHIGAKMAFFTLLQENGKKLFLAAVCVFEKDMENLQLFQSWSIQNTLFSTTILGGCCFFAPCNEKPGDIYS